MMNHPRMSLGLELQESLPVRRPTGCCRGRTARRRRRAPSPGPCICCRTRRLPLQRGLRPITALLQEVVISSCAADGTTFAVIHLVDPAGQGHLRLVTSDRFGEIGFLELLTGTTVNLDPAGPGMDLLPLARLGPEAHQHVLDQLLAAHRRVVTSGRDDTFAREQISAFLNQLVSQPLDP